MNCSNCKTAMIKGKVTLDRTWYSALFFGFGSSVLRFQKEGSYNKLKLMDLWSVNRAYHCENCGAVTIATDKIK
jgi:hypothetical protein